MVSTHTAGTGAEEADGRSALIHKKLVCLGAVQGVGFRPSVYRLAKSLGLVGSIRNDEEGATIEIEGTPNQVADFVARLPGALGPLARLEAVQESILPLVGLSDFHVDSSHLDRRHLALVPADARICDNCAEEMADPEDRRHHYPFTTCTDCGPRFTIVESLPYDRERTSMQDFELCPECRKEYEDPASRRFRAEAVCCPECGPELRLLSPTGTPLVGGGEVLARARELLAKGAILALKGLGGYQVACRAYQAACIQRLRRRKARTTKPFALMVPDLQAARRLAHLEPRDEELLSSPASPILIVPKRSGTGISSAVHPGLSDVGIMLPTTPLHRELFRGAEFDALVMTSGNLSEEPICREEEEALDRLVAVSDALLVHDRRIVRRCDDSVARSMPHGHLLMRRSRGYVPDPLPLAVRASEPVLALGAHLQTTACLAVEDMAIPSQHVGDLDSLAARSFLLEVAKGLEEFLQCEARLLAVDLHPDYPSTWEGQRLAREREGRVLRLQHHLAHAAAVLGECRAFPGPGETVAALILDGTGYGLDNTAWGSELLVMNGDLEWNRRGHGVTLPLVGGERAVRDPWRILAAAYARHGQADLLGLLPMASGVDPLQLQQITLLSTRPGWPQSSGAGRIFEAAGSLFALALRNDYEGEAAARFESLAASARSGIPAWPGLDALVSDEEVATDLLLIMAGERLLAGEPARVVAAGFHASFCRLFGILARKRLPRGIGAIALGGGCFVNRLLVQGCLDEFHEMGLDVLLPRDVPAGDGGLSYGQCTLAALALERRKDPQQAGD